MLVVIQCFILLQLLQHIVLSAIYGKILGFVLFTHFFSTFLGGPKKCPHVIIASRCAICSGERVNLQENEDQTEVYSKENTGSSLREDPNIQCFYDFL